MKHGNTGNQNARKDAGEKKPRIRWVNVSIHPQDAERWRRFAEAEGLSLSAYIKSKLP